jgi:hypothetical protein
MCTQQIINRYESITSLFNNSMYVIIDINNFFFVRSSATKREKNRYESKVNRSFYFFMISIISIMFYIIQDLVN